MKVFAIGGTTQDIFLQNAGADTMTINKRNAAQTYMLFESGQKVEIEELYYLTGGGATNSAVSFKRLGFDVSCFCTIGTDAAGKIIIENLAAEGVNTAFIRKTSDHPTGISCILNTQHGERTVFAYRG